MTRVFSFALFALAGIGLAGAGCSSSSAPVTDDASSGDSGGTSPSDGGPSIDGAPAVEGGADAGPAALSWYMTCGDPVCQAPDFDAGPIDAGSCPDLGSSCSSMGQTCGTPNPAIACGAIEVCDNHDPSRDGCPMSSQKFKDDIEYLDSAQLEKLHDETLRMRLATYNYKGQYADPNPKHLGFVIEDNPQSLAVRRGHDQVDLYGYLSMVVATMQVQEKEIASLKRELAAARKGGVPGALK